MTIQEIDQLKKLKELAKLLLPIAKCGRKEGTDNQVEVRYNELGDILYIRFIPGEAANGEAMEDGSYVRYDEQGNIMSWEMMEISQEVEE